MSDGRFTNYLPTGMTVKDTTRRMEILDMCWEYNNEERVWKLYRFSYVHLLAISNTVETVSVDT